MPRSKSSDEISAICQRFCNIVENDLNISYTTLAKQLGYANSSPFTRVRKHQGFIEYDKLIQFINLTNRFGKLVDLNWLITGVKGTNPIQTNNFSEHRPHLIDLISKLDTKTLDNLEHVISNLLQSSPGKV